MDQIMKAPEGERCGSFGRVAGEAFNCLLHVGHAGPHASEAAPGETVTWHNSAPGGLNLTGFIGPYGLKPDTPEELRQQRTEEILERQREDRRDAVELAVKALNGVTNADTIEEYGNNIVDLAVQLGAYILYGERT